MLPGHEKIQSGLLCVEVRGVSLDFNYVTFWKRWKFGDDYFYSQLVASSVGRKVVQVWGGVHGQKYTVWCHYIYLKAKDTHSENELWRTLWTWGDNEMSMWVGSCVCDEGKGYMGGTGFVFKFAINLKLFYINTISWDVKSFTRIHADK